MNLEAYADSFECGVYLVGGRFLKTAENSQPVLVAVPSMPQMYPGMQLVTLPQGKEEKKQSSTNPALRYLPVLALVTLGLMFGPKLLGWLSSSDRKGQNKPQTLPPELADFRRQIIAEHKPEFASIVSPWAQALATAQEFRTFNDAFDKLF